MKLKIDQTRIDGNTQQRAIDQPTAERYKALMQDNVVFPPVDVIYDGRDYWLWNGFQRYHAAKAIGLTEVRAKSSNGTRRDAIFLSFGLIKTTACPDSPAWRKRLSPRCSVTRGGRKCRCQI